MNSNKTSKRGGARKGSGRKALNHVYLHIRIPKDIAEIIKQKAKEELFNAKQRVTLDNLFDQLSEGDL